MTRLDSILDDLRFSHAYTNGLLDAVPPENWFRIPEGGVTHVAWQVGHLAWAEHRLVMERVLGRGHEETGLIPAMFGPLFGKGSTPRSGADGHPPADEIRRVYNRMHEAALEAINGLGEATLTEPSLPPHPAFQDKGGALLWAARHELVHAGQIALIRRQLGYEPLR